MQERNEWACLQGDNRHHRQLAPHGEARMRNTGEYRQGASPEEQRCGEPQARTYTLVQMRHTTTCHWSHGCHDCQCANTAAHTQRNSGGFTL